MTSIEELKETIRNCTRCDLAKTRKNPVPGEGDLDARLFLVAQAPGEKEDEEGEMFIGRSGEILDDFLGYAGMEREQFYMTNLLKCLLPGYRRPKRDEIGQCSRYLEKEIEIVDPEVLVPLGYYPARSILEQYGIEVPDDKSRIFNRIWFNQGQKIYPLGHPAAIVYDDSLKEEMREDYGKLRVLSKDCKWYSLCPMRRFYRRGELDQKWIEIYCKGDWENCKRFQAEKAGEPHPDWMLPDGTLRERLKVLSENG